MKKILALVALSLCSLGAGALAQQGDHNHALMMAIDNPQRSEANKARDVYRHPYETLTFFGVQPTHTVVEMFPGGGWYTEILTPYLANGGRLIPARSAEIPAAPGSVDVILDFRNAHNWMGGNAVGMVQSWHAALKPGGVVGLVDHRHDPDVPFVAGRGYILEQQIIDLMQANGFQLEARSEINANPLDTKDHPGGVWNLPPTLQNVSDADRAKYLAIGESDRMTLKFVKR
jgi:predicted methyltransferase